MTQIRILAFTIICSLFAIAHARVEQPPVKQLTAIQQTGNTCGSHAAINAKAIQELLRTTPISKITAQAVNNIAARYKGFIKPTALEAFEIIDLCDRLDIHSVYIVTFSPANNRIVPAGCGSKTFLDLDTCLDHMKRDPQQQALIICNTGGHWVLAAILKERKEKPQIFYWDSVNTPLKNGSIANRITKSLAAKIAS